MAEVISEIVGKEAYDQIKKLDEQLGDLVKKFENNTRAVLILEQALSNAKMPMDDLKKVAEELNKKEAEQVQIANDVVKKSEQKAAATKVYTNAINEQQKAELERQQSATAWASKEAKISADTVKQRKAEAVSIASLTEENKKLRAERDKLDVSTAIGRQKIKDLNEGIAENNRIILANQDVVKKQAANVGNYASATTNLNAETKKISGTMASFTGVVGKAWGALRQLAYIIPGLGIAGIMGIAIDGILMLANSFDLLSTKTKEEIESAKVLSDVHKEMVKNIGEETALLEVNYQTAVNTNLSYKERGKAVDYLQKQYPEMFNNANREKLLNGELSGSYALLTTQIHKRAEETANLNLLNRKVLERTETQLQLDQLMGKGQGKDEFYYTNKSAEALRAKLSLQSREIGMIEDKIQKNKEGFGNDVYYIDETVKRQVEAQNKIDKYYAEHGAPSKSAKSGKSAASLTKPVINPKLSDTDLADLKAYYENISKQQIKVMGEMMNDPASKKAFEDFLTSGVLNGDQSISDEAAKKLADDLIKRIEDNAKKLQLKIDKEKSLKEATELLNEINAITQQYGKAASDIADAIAMQANLKADNEIKNIDRVLQADLDALDRRAMSQKQKDAERARLEAVAEARRKAIDRDRIKAMRTAASIQKAADIANIITSTALAVVGFLAKPGGYPGIALSIGAGVAGAAELAKAIATPLPQYFKGTDSKPMDGPAWVGEKGIEKITLPDGTTFLSPGVPTIMDLPKKTEIKPHEETMRELMYDINAAAFRKMASADFSKHDSYNSAILESINELSMDTKRLIKIMNGKNYENNFYGDTQNIAHINKAIS
jgi:hypothetical protein